MCCAPASPGCTTVSTSCRSSRRSTAPTPALIRSTKVDPRLGSWDDVAELSKSHDIIVDAIVNHMSWESAQFQDVLKNGEKSEYYPMFLTMSSVFPNGATEEDLAGIYRPRGESRKSRAPKSLTRRGRHIGRAASSCNMRTLR